MIITKGIDQDCFAEMLGGRKYYELRLGDFPGQPGDLLALEEKDANEARTGRRLAAEITYVSRFTLDELPWPRADVDHHGIALMSIDLLAQGRGLPASGDDVCLKAWPRYFGEVCARRKRYELRLGDRLCAPGATLRLSEFVSAADPEYSDGPLGFTGQHARVRVTQSRRWTLAELGRFWPLEEIEAKGLCVISLRLVDPA